MRKVIYFAMGTMLTFQIAMGQSPHGNGFTIDCAECHSADNWTFNKNANTFNHDNTSFPLTGQHTELECRSCHSSLEFNKVSSDCISCHTDFHQQTVGNDCARCHTPASWIVENITQLHEKISFPLMGAHAIINCNTCHQNETNLRFSPISPECISCHSQDYETAKMPDHITLGFPVDCSQCHRQTGMNWIGEGIVHSFFPLEQGHKINDCSQCHKSSTYKDITPDCINCHKTDLANAHSPDHSLFPTQCNLCHTLAQGWMPAAFANHDARFPIYSGKHKGAWDQCTDCHKTQGNFNSFTCIECHEHNNAGNLAKNHNEVRGYQFESMACYSCHPKGN